MSKKNTKIKKRFILIGLIVLLVLISVGFLVVNSGKFRFNAATSEEVISNTATVTYQDASGQVYTGTSNTIETQIAEGLTVVLSANPTAISPGGSSVLTWDIAGFAVGECSATPSGWWTDTLIGSATVTPLVSTSYELVCNNGTDPVTATATVNINSEPTPTPTESVTPTSIPPTPTPTSSGYTLNIKLSLDGKQSSASSTLFRIYQKNQISGTPIYTATIDTSDDGTAQIAGITGVEPGASYEYWIKPQNFLSTNLCDPADNKSDNSNNNHPNPATAPGIVFEDNMNLYFGVMRSGDLLDNNSISGPEYNTFYRCFGSQSGDPNYQPVCDLTGAGSVSGPAYNKFFRVFGLAGDLPPK